MNHMNIHGSQPQILAEHTMHENATPPSTDLDFLSVAPETETETPAHAQTARQPLQRSPTENISSVHRDTLSKKSIANIGNVAYDSAGSGCKPAISSFASDNSGASDISSTENYSIGNFQTSKNTVSSCRSPARSRMSVFASPSRVHKNGSALSDRSDSLHPQEISSVPQTPKRPDSASPYKLGKSGNDIDISGSHSVQKSHIPYSMGPSSSRNENLPKTPKTPRTPQTPKMQAQSFLDETPSKFTVPGLQKRCAELYSQVLTASTDLRHAEKELLEKSKLVGELTQKVANSEKLLRRLEDEKRKESEIHTQEKRFFTDSIEELQRQNLRLSARIEQDQALAESMALEHNEKYAKLHKSFKALQSNFELEQNSKALLIDQIEFLTKERDILLESERRDFHHQHQHSHIPSPDTDTENEPNLDGNVDMGLADLGVSEFHGLGTPNSVPSDFERMLANQNSDENLLAKLQERHVTEPKASNTEAFDAVSDVVSVSDSGSDLDSDSDGSVHGTHLLSSYAELSGAQGLTSSSPMKNHPEKADFETPNSDSEFHEMAPEFQFPRPNPQEKAKYLKRQSLPAQLKLNSSFDDEFVLSPLKLTAQANTSYFDDSSVSASTRPNSIIKKRYSGTRANHSRFNSHDILPIKVEFEQLNQQLRSASAPHKESQLSPRLSSVAEANPIEDTDMAFMKLNGYTMPTKRDSLMTDSSKRSSFMSDFNVSAGDITKQEITKLKFELQSLKLHNEKLLSYIGFELQKQKKNIKKLSSKQNLRDRAETMKMAPKKIEYSDAKLIEKSREMLIHKKRVLRSVSINPGVPPGVPPGVSVPHSDRRCSTMLHSFVGLGGMPGNVEDDDDFMFKSHFISSLKTESLDEYDSFKRGSRFDIHANSHFQIQPGGLDQKSLKKHRSQTFARAGQLAILDSSGDESFTSIDEDSDEDGDQNFLHDHNHDHVHDGYSANVESNGEWESSSENSSGSEVNYGELGTFGQMKYLILGKEHVKKSKKADTLSDDGLKYKFLTIALGIVIVGIRLTSHPQQQLTGS